MGKLKVAFVLDDTLDTPDGVQQYILTMGNWLTRQGHEVHYIVGHTTRTDIPNVHSLGRNIRVTFNGNTMSTPLPVSKRQIKQLLEYEQFDVLHVQVPYSPYLAGRIIAMAPAHTAIIGTFHIAPNSNTVTRANKFLGKLNAGTLKRFNVMFSTSTAAAAFAKNTHHIDTTVLPNVVVSNTFREAVPFPVAQGPRLTVVYLGRLVPRKGCQVLLQALSRLHANEPLSCKVYICGKGPLSSQLQQYVQEHNLQDVVEFTGFVSEQDKARYLKTADIAVFPSTGGESFGIVLIEAMAAEHPVVVAADNEGYHTVMEPYPGSLVPVADSEALAAKLKSLLTDEPQRAKALEWQKSYIRQFDVAVVGPRLVARYLQALRSTNSVR